MAELYTDPPWLWRRPEHNAIECHECGADRALGDADVPTAVAAFRHNPDCSETPHKWQSPEIDHHFTDGMICPWCGYQQGDIFEITGAYDEDEVRVECGGCEQPFVSTCSVSYSFYTDKVDVEEERREAAEERREVAERLELCRRFPPGTRIRIVGDRYADYLNGRVGAVANKELSKHNPFVYVDLDPCERDGVPLPAYTMSVWPANVQREEEPVG